jgi:hypothetical protein
MNHEIYIQTDLYQAGNGDDGMPYYAELYYVTVQYDDGRILRHDRSFLGAERDYDEEGMVFFFDVRERAMEEAERLAEECRRSKDFTDWEELDPVYGSEAYINQKTEAKRAYADRQEN